MHMKRRPRVERCDSEWATRPRGRGLAPGWMRRVGAADRDLRAPAIWSLEAVAARRAFDRLPVARSSAAVLTVARVLGDAGGCA